MEFRIDIPTGVEFGTVYADPPWPHDEKQNARRRLHYDRMTLDEIKAIPVGSFTTADAHLWLWTTTTHLPLALDVIEAWGFQYRAIRVWRKSKLGLGWWVRNRHEFLLLAAKSTKMRTNPGSLTSEITGRYVKHSQKPDVYEDIETHSPGPFLELFSRVERPREGWTTLGSDGVPSEPYNAVVKLRGNAPDRLDGIVRGVGGLEVVPDREYHYLERVIQHIPVKAIKQNGRRVTIEMPDGKRKSVSIDKLRPAEA